MLRLLLVHLPLALAVATTCPYANSTGDTLTSGKYCTPGVSVCRVNALCSEVWRSVSPVTTKITRLASIGNLSSYEATKLLVQNCSSGFRLDPTAFALPPSLTVFGLENCPMQGPMPSVSWPLSLTELNGSLVTIPRGLPLSLEELSVERNQLRVLKDVDLTRTQKAYFGGNPLTVLSRVHFSKSLQLFKCNGCNFVLFVVDTKSFEALDALPAFDPATQLGLLVESINSDAAYCVNTIKGTIRMLHAKYPVCVSGAYITTDRGGEPKCY
ncbi:hypothetical protein SPRG_07171 [Saprolegnia parasitica CBS 223.65]|uniref:Leucine-rich repeat-containing N-terminal plant-type domain-containing protein n=1 Tax=Saprolegnia parasitica (strain CBS 223.65) TaxID=695850 RepID=A0A067CBL8_SAPPC|nr:hypothetical protein SPRG_07171 [Saprolegnia parasitica CBS 223.65]KDO27898.1 hypothetical protein SPRG_07171 [Saprolegnia parasitica CBS 223.65]|eukprot:XP_012201355.1 hypothetical protein SPRG_07171 [Saprolegnia parasitica CBS 223.65]